MIKRKLNKNNKVIKHTKLATERLKQAMERITITQKWKKKDNTLKALINLKSALLKYPPVPKLIEVDS